MRQNFRFAFTLVELLVVLGLVGVVLAIALPAVQCVREGARRVQCQNNLRQIGLALSEHESVHKTLPPGRDARHGWQHSWVTAILPYLEQTALHQQYDYSRAWDDPANLPAATADLAVFRCPSAVLDWPGKSDYGGNYGSALTGLRPGFQQGFAWEAGTLLPVHIAMPGSHRRAPVAIAEILDGASNTLVVLEDADRPASEGGMWANGHNCFSHDNGPVNNSISQEIFSRHPGGACVLLADGSNRFLVESTSSWILGALATRAEGELSR